MPESFALPPPLSPTIKPPHPHIDPISASIIAYAVSSLHLVSRIPLNLLLRLLQAAHGVRFTSTQSSPLIQPHAIAAAENLPILPTLEYAYDPLPAEPPTLQHFRFPSSTTSPLTRSPNAITLSPIMAGFPYRSSIDHVQASRYWAANLQETIELLALLATDQSASDIEVRQGLTLKKLAFKALAPGREHQIVLATLFMFPGADEDRIKHIAALMIIYFIFDDKVEETPNKELQNFRDNFLDLLKCQGNDTRPFQSHVRDILRAISANDNGSTNCCGGHDMIQALRTAFHCVRPSASGFEDLPKYMSFRRQNVGASFVIAAAKYSLNSSVDLQDPRYATFFTLISDHLGLVNDLASYDKELQALAKGDTEDMINFVNVIKEINGLRGTDDAKAVTWKIQLQMERDIMAEIDQLSVRATEEELRFLEAVLVTATGNVCFCMVTSRYGGEATRIKRK